MNDMMSILFASGNESKLNELTLQRTSASLPFGGRYRLIDFTLSNLVNSGITQIAVITSSKYQSLMDHIRQGRDWDLNRKNAGIHVFPPFVYNNSADIYKGKIEAIYAIMTFINKAKEDYIVIANSNIAANIDYDKIFDSHIKSGAKVTMLCHDGQTTTSRRIVIEKDENNVVTDIYETETASTEEKLISLNSYIIEKALLLDLVKKAYARGQVDFEKDILFKLVEEKSVAAYKLESYAAIVDDIKTYYNESMNLLNKDVREQLFDGSSVIYTKVKDSVPTMYKDGAKVVDSLIADGCVIEGTVENSILFRNVKVGKGAIVKNSIVMENGKIEDNASLKYAITDKDVTISEKREISGFATYPMVIAKGKTV